MSLAGIPTITVDLYSPIEEWCISSDVFLPEGIYPFSTVTSRSLDFRSTGCSWWPAADLLNFVCVGVRVFLYICIMYILFILYEFIWFVFYIWIHRRWNISQWCDPQNPFTSPFPIIQDTYFDVLIPSFHSGHNPFPVDSPWLLGYGVRSSHYTPLKINIFTEDWWLEDEISSSKWSLLWGHVNFFWG